MIIDYRGQRLEFPDDMAQEDIEAALAQMDETEAAREEQAQAPDLTTGPLSALPEPVQAGILGAGRTIDKGLAGAEDLYLRDQANQQRYMGPDGNVIPPGQTPNPADITQLEALKQQQMMRDQAYAGVKQQHPLAATVGEMVPYLATAPLSGGMATQMAIGGGLDALMHQQDPSQRVNAGAGGAAWSALPFGISKGLGLGGGMPSNLATRADELNIPLMPAERTGSWPLKLLDAGVESNPLTSGGVQATKQARQDAINRIAADAMGETLDDVSDLSGDALGKIAERIGNQFEELLSDKSIPFDFEFYENLANVSDAARRGILGGDETGKIVKKMLDEGRRGGTISGETIQGWRSTLNKAAVQARRSDTTSPDYADSLESILDALDDAIVRNLEPDEVVKWNTSKQQWTAFKRLEKAKAIDEAGDVSGAKLGNSLRANDPVGYGRGLNESPLYDAARIAKQTRPYQDSGTAGRLISAGLVAGGLFDPTLWGAAIGGNVYGRLAPSVGRTAAAVNRLAEKVGGAKSLIGRAGAGLDEDSNTLIDYVGNALDSWINSDEPLDTLYNQLIDNGMDEEEAREAAQEAEEIKISMVVEEDLDSVMKVIQRRTNEDTAGKLENSQVLRDWTYAHRDYDHDPTETRDARRDLESILVGQGIEPYKASLISYDITDPKQVDPLYEAVA